MIKKFTLKADSGEERLGRREEGVFCGQNLWL